MAVILASVPIGCAFADTYNLNLSDGSLVNNNGIFTLNLGTNGTITFSGYSCAYALCNMTPSTSEALLPFGLSVVAGALGLSDGLGGETPVPRNDFIVIDFSNVKGPLASVTLNTVNVFDGWDIYRTFQPNQLASEFSRGPTPIAQGNNNTDYPTSGTGTNVYPNINSTIATGATSGSSTFVLTSPYVSFTALQAVCDGCPKAELLSIGLSYAVPEPETRG